MHWLLNGLAAIALAGVVLWLTSALLLPMPVPAPDRAISTALPRDPGTTLGPRAVAAETEHRGLTGVIPLADGVLALRSRIELAQQAERSIDAQYYIWDDDVASLLLLGALRDAALRGVRVRLLLDDNGIGSRIEPWLIGLDQLDNFEVRLFNASPIRWPKHAGYVLHPVRMNRRMHNKSFIVDGAAAIVGGRNIGNAYFHVGEGSHYFDLDVLGVGQVVPDTATVFDAYWNAKAVVRIGRITSGTGDLAGLDAAVDAAWRNDDAQVLRSAPATPEAPELHWTTVSVVADDPAKGLGNGSEILMIDELTKLLGKVETTLDVISSYFVPGKRGTEIFTDLAQQGKRVRVLTNSLAATDVPLVHAGYSKKRKQLLKAGVELYELRPLPGTTQGRAELGTLGLSGSSLHAKTFITDDSRIFIGSFNFDPRSAMLNCEMGFLIDSPALARTSAESFTTDIVNASLRPELTPSGLVWHERLPDGSIRTYTTEPGASLTSQALVALLGLLPIEWLL